MGQVALPLGDYILLKCLTAWQQRVTSTSPDPGAEPSRTAAQAQDIACHVAYRGSDMQKAIVAGARRRYGLLWFAIGGGVGSGGWLWPTWASAAEAAKIDAGDTAWVLISSALVLMMVAPGLALFYGGLVRRKNVLATLMHSFILVGLISVQWVLWG